MYKYLLITLAYSFSFINAQINTTLLHNKLDSLFLNHNSNLPGGALHIEQANQILYFKVFGLTSNNTTDKFTELTISNIGSLSNSFVAYSILILQKQNKLSLNDSLITFYPNIKKYQMPIK